MRSSDSWIDQVPFMQRMPGAPSREFSVNPGTSREFANIEVCLSMISSESWIDQVPRLQRIPLAPPREFESALGAYDLRRISSGDLEWLQSQKFNLVTIYVSTFLGPALLDGSYPVGMGLRSVMPSSLRYDSKPPIEYIIFNSYLPYNTQRLPSNQLRFQYWG